MPAIDGRPLTSVAPSSVASNSRTRNPPLAENDRSRTSRTAPSIGRTSDSPATAAPPPARFRHIDKLRRGSLPLQVEPQQPGRRALPLGRRRPVLLQGGLRPREQEPPGRLDPHPLEPQVLPHPPPRLAPPHERPRHRERPEMPPRLPVEAIQRRRDLRPHPLRADEQIAIRPLRDPLRVHRPRRHPRPVPPRQAHHPDDGHVPLVQPPVSHVDSDAKDPRLVLRVRDRQVLPARSPSYARPDSPPTLTPPTSSSPETVAWPRYSIDAIRSPWRAIAGAVVRTRDTTTSDRLNRLISINSLSRRSVPSARLPAADGVEDEDEHACQQRGCAGRGDGLLR